jgi:hypothetical protein
MLIHVPSFGAERDHHSYPFTEALIGDADGYCFRDT